jgi:hypothetical protein
MDAPAPASPTPRRFRIALSFPGEHRPFVEQVAERLAAAEVTAPLLDLKGPSWNRILSRLCDLRLVVFTGPRGSPALDAHPLLRECFAEQVRTGFPAAWRAGHRRLFEHLGGSVPYWPEGIEGLQPLYQAVAHGCSAGLEQQALDIYYGRILRGTGPAGFYSWKKLGAIGADLGAVACFFATPWTTCRCSRLTFSSIAPASSAIALRWPRRAA